MVAGSGCAVVLVELHDIIIRAESSGYKEPTSLDVYDIFVSLTKLMRGHF